MKKIISVLISIACIMHGCLFAVAEESNWAETVIYNAETKSYIPDNTNTEFYAKPVTRAEFITLTSRLMGYKDYVEYKGFFKDVAGTEWYAPYVQFALDKGFLHEGITREKRFKADSVVTSEEMAIILTLATNPSWDMIITTTLYDDHSDISDWARRQISQAISVGYIKESDEIHLSPQRQITVAEALEMLEYAAALTAEQTSSVGDSIMGESEYGVFSPENYIVNDFTDLAKWNYIIRTDDAKGTVSHLANEGSSPEDGCIFYDLESSGVSRINALQVKYELHKENAIEAGKKYKCGFKAKLTDNNIDENATLDIGRANLRDVIDGNVVWSDGNRVFNVIESDGWINYEIEFTATETHSDVVLMFMMGGDGNVNIKVYFDDFYWVPVNDDEENIFPNTSDEALIRTIIDDETNCNDVQMSVNENISEYPVLTGVTTKESGLLFNYWRDPYRNKISPNSVYTAPVLQSYTYRAGFAPYDYKDKSFKVPVSEDISVTTTVPSINGITASASGKVTLPEGYRLLDAGTLFYGGYWTENFNLFSENIENIPAYTVSESGEFSSQTVMNTRYGVLARTYAIIENPEGFIMVQYSDTEYIHSPNRPEKINHKGIAYYELLQSFQNASITNTPEYNMSRIDDVALTGADIITVTPSEHKFNMWNSKVDTYWTDEAKYEGNQNHNVKEKTKDYIFNGGDPVQDAVDGAHRNDMYIFIDQRMNDHHYSANSSWTTHSTLWKKNPHFWVRDVVEVNTTGSTDGDVTWRVFNYMIPEVREYFYRLIEELVTLYDVDGVQMDFDRHEVYFLNTEVDMGSEVLTEFVGRVREMVNRASIDRGKDIQVSVRLDDSVEKAHKAGWNVEEWCRRDYVDILNVGDTYTNHMAVDIEGFKAIANKAKVFGEVHYLTIERPPNKQRRHVTEQLAFATAKSFYDRGADGISLFNFQYFNDKAKDIYVNLPPCFDKKLLETVEKNYAFTQGRGPWGFGSRTDFDFEFFISENTENYDSIIARLEHASAATSKNTRFILNGIELKEITRTDTEMFAPYTQTAHAIPENCKFFEIPRSALIDGENHFVIDSELVVQSMHIAFYN